ncbi:hypothetical protein [Bacteroides zoogleoformans]|uniref:hypothetical protein n=1 Tax=Bacteroides zoogleoformans TaxID=28119 RepID=UPI00248E7937|nr:hypothetical protein [Bacteroides zoogleoformans]
MKFAPHILRISSVSAPYNLRIISVSPPYDLRITSAPIDAEQIRAWYGAGMEESP